MYFKTRKDIILTNTVYKLYKILYFLANYTFMSFKSIMKIQNSNINFQAGLTRNMRQEIEHTDITKVTNYFCKNNIETDFKNNKTIAWSSLKVFDIIKKLNSQFNLKLGLPQQILVEDFNILKLPQKFAFGIMNFAPTKLYTNQDTIVPEKAIVFNEFKDYNYSSGNKIWDKIDEIADFGYEHQMSSTDFFLETIFHEFAHAIHEENLINTLGGNKLLGLLEKTFVPDFINKFQQKYKNQFDNICKYANSNWIETVACDLSKRAMAGLDKEKLIPKSDFIQDSPYRKIKFLNILKTSKQDKKLHKFWNGKVSI